MELLYLLFDFTDDEDGRGGFDAMASVRPDRVPAVAAEAGAVLRWAHERFGAPAQDDGDWDFDLHAVAQPGRALEARYDEARREVVVAPAGDAPRVTLTLTLGGSRAFCEAFRETFALD